MDRSSKQKVNKEIKALNDTLDQIDITDIFRTFHPSTIEYTFFFSAHFPEQTTSWVINQVSTGIKRLGSFPAYFHTTML